MMEEMLFHRDNMMRTFAESWIELMSLIINGLKEIIIHAFKSVEYELSRAYFDVVLF